MWVIKPGDAQPTRIEDGTYDYWRGQGYREWQPDEAAQFTDPTSPVAAALKAAYVTPRQAQRPPVGIAFCGDSLTNFWYPMAEAYPFQLAFQSGGYLRYRGKFALGGITLADVETTYLPAALALNPLPGAVLLAAGTNDMSQAGYSLTTAAATLRRLIATCRAAGVLPILWLVPPRQDNATYNTRGAQWNAFVRYLANSEGLPYFDFWTPLVDPATGTTLATYVGDQIHPNYAGHQAAVAYNLGRPHFQSRFADGTPHLTTSAVDPVNLLGSGYGLFPSMGATYPTGWTGFGTMTVSLVTDAQASGNWMRLTRLAASTGNAAVNPQTSLTVAAGDVIALACRVRHNYAMAANTTQAGVQISLNPQDAANAALGTGYLYGPSFGNYTGVAYGEMVMPAGTVKVKPEIRIQGTASADSTVDIAQFTVLNLTQLGAAGLTTTAVL